MADERKIDEIEYLMMLGKKVRHFRKEKGFSQEKLALESETDASYVRKIERGLQNVTILSLRNIAIALDVDVKEFL